jgi:hypothetical protein
MISLIHSSLCDFNSSSGERRPRRVVVVPIVLTGERSHRAKPFVCGLLMIEVRYFKFVNVDNQNCMQASDPVSAL